MKATTAFLLILAAATATAVPSPEARQHSRRQNAKEYDVLTTPDADIAALLASAPIASDDAAAAISATFDNPRFRGFSGAFTEEEVAALRAAEGGVVVSVREAVEEEMVVPEMRRRRRVKGQQKKREVAAAQKKRQQSGGIKSRDDATWGLQRISQEGTVEVEGSTTGRG